MLGKFFKLPIPKPERKPPVKRYVDLGAGPKCLECGERAPHWSNGIPQIVHHERCLTGQWEDARRDKKIYIAPKPRPFRVVTR